MSSPFRKAPASPVQAPTVPGATPRATPRAVLSLAAPRASSPTPGAAPAAPMRGPRSRGGGATLDAPPPNLATAAPRAGTPLNFGELIELYYVSHPDKYDGSLVKWLSWFGLSDVSAWSITAEQLADGVTYMRDVKGYAPGTCNRNLGTLGTIYRWAQKMRHTPPGFKSPTLGENLRQSEGMRYVEPPRPGEWKLIRDLARTQFRDPRFTLFVWLVMDTGARRGEIADRTWSDFDLDAPEGPNVTLRDIDTKTDRARRLYFSQETASLLRRLRPTAERYRAELVFKSRSSTAPNKYRKPWERLCKMIGRPELHLHDLRHMMAAQLLKDGKGMSQVASILGHSSLILHRRYGHLDDAALREIQSERLAEFNNQGQELPAVVDARRREAERRERAPQDAADELNRLVLLAQDGAAQLAALHAAIEAAKAKLQNSGR